jgi:excinuclease UvrABC nuclease subunit
MENTEFTLLTQQIAALTTLTNAQFINVNDRLDKINGRVQKHDEAITQALVERGANRQKQEDYFNQIDEMNKKLNVVEIKENSHIITCPNIPKIRALEDSQLSTKSIKKWVFTSVTIGLAVGGFIVAIIELVIKMK